MRLFISKIDQIFLEEKILSICTRKEIRLRKVVQLIDHLQLRYEFHVVKEYIVLIIEHTS